MTKMEVYTKPWKFHSSTATYLEGQSEFFLRLLSLILWLGGNCKHRYIFLFELIKEFGKLLEVVLTNRYVNHAYNYKTCDSAGYRHT